MTDSDQTNRDDDQPGPGQMRQEGDRPGPDVKQREGGRPGPDVKQREGDRPGPDVKQRPEKEKEKKSPFRFSFFWVMMVLLAVLIMGQFFAGKPDGLSNLEFKRCVEEGRIRKLYVSAKRMRGEYRDTAPDTGEERWVRFTRPRVTLEGDINYLEDKNVDYHAEDDSDGLWQMLWWIFPLAIIIGFWIFMMRKMNPSQQVMSFGKSKAKIYAEKEIQVDFGDVAGIDEAVEEVKEIVDFLREPEKFQALGARIPKGVLLLGAPGTGKTLLARAVAGEAEVPFFSLSGSDFVEMFVGVGASRVRDLFKQAGQQAPCIVFIDELDALGKSRGVSPVSNDEREQTLNALLVEMDGFEPNSGVIIMAATNRPEILDQALMRPGRFDRQIVVDKPDIKGRELILEVHARAVKLGDDVDLAVIAARTPGFAGADLANIINESALLAARRDKSAVSMNELEEAIDRTIAGLEKKKNLMTAKEKEIVAYHESGHALVSSMLPECDPVHRISIIPRGMGSLGHTLYLPTDERYLLTVVELKNRMASLLGGRAAEIVVFGQVSTGAQNDLERCSKLARRMVTEYGMSEKMGAVSYEAERRSYLGWDPNGGKRDYSEETGREIDEEVKILVTAAEDLALKTLKDNRDLLERIAIRLAEVELIDREELEELLGFDKAIDDPDEPPTVPEPAAPEASAEVEPSAGAEFEPEAGSESEPDPELEPER
jgi:cell division protease FtsH